MRLIVLLVLALPAPRPVLDAQGARGTLAGTVADAASGAPLRAALSVERPRRAARADSAGRFRFTALPAGELRLRAHAFGYVDVDTLVRVRAGETTQVVLQLRPAPRALAAVRTVAKSPERERFEAGATPSVVSIGGEELSRIPAVGERDPLRAVALLPGVVARNDFSAGFNVRGGEADQNLVLLDGIPIYNPFHLGGLFGTFIDAAVDRVDVLTGGFPASYGGRLSSVLDVASTTSTRSGVHGAADLSLLSSSARLGGSLGGERASWTLAARRTYADKLVEAVRGTNDFPYHFADVQLHATAALPRAGTLAFTAYGGEDLLSLAPARDAFTAGDFGDGALDFGWGNRVAGLTLTQPLGARTMLLQQAAVSGFATQFHVPAESLLLRQRVEEVRLAGRLTLTRAAHTLAVGYELARYRTAYRERLSLEADSLFPDLFATVGDTTIRQRASSAVVYLDDRWQPSERLQLRPGVRLESVPGAGWWGVSPRVSATYFVSRDFALTAAAGRYAQWMRAMRNEDLPVRLFDLWVVSDEHVPVSTATHLVLGAERWLSPSRFLRVEAYGKRYATLSEPASTVDPRIRPTFLRYFDGTSYGVDVFVRQLPRNGLGGWLTYGYGVSMREREGQRYFPAHDRRHNANLVLSWAPGARYVFSARGALASGTPYTGWAGVMSRWRYDPIHKEWILTTPKGDDDIVRGPRNAERYPLYSRVDVGVERRFELGPATLVPRLDVVNVFNQRNVFLHVLNTGREPMAITTYSQLPLLPSVGLRVEF